MLPFLINKGENQVRKTILITQDVKDKAMVESRVIFNIFLLLLSIKQCLHHPWMFRKVEGYISSMVENILYLYD